MSDDTDPTQTSQKQTPEEIKAANKLREVLADTYSFVRSVEVNRTILSFTFDHYIDEAKRVIKEDRILNSAVSTENGVGNRPSKLNALTKLKTDFNNSFDKLQKLAQAKDAAGK